MCLRPPKPLVTQNRSRCPPPPQRRQFGGARWWRWGAGSGSGRRRTAAGAPAGWSWTPGRPPPTGAARSWALASRFPRCFFKCGAVEVRASRKAGVGWIRRSQTFPFAPPALPFCPRGISSVAQHRPGFFPSNFNFEHLRRRFTREGGWDGSPLPPGSIFSSLPSPPAFVDVVPLSRRSNVQPIHDFFSQLWIRRFHSFRNVGELHHCEHLNHHPSGFGAARGMGPGRWSFIHPEAAVGPWAGPPPPPMVPPQGRAGPPEHRGRPPDALRVRPAVWGPGPPLRTDATSLSPMGRGGGEGRSSVADRRYSPPDPHPLPDLVPRSF